MRHKILVIKLWAIGEVALATPCINRLKNIYPESNIYFLVSNKSKDIIIGNPDIIKALSIEENIFLGPDLARLFSLIIKLKRERFDMIVTLHYHKYFSVFAFLIGAPVRLGFKRPGSWSLNTADITSDGATDHKIFENLKIFKLLLSSPPDMNIEIKIHPSEEDKKHVSALMKESDIRSKKFIILSPTGGENSAASKFNSNIKNKVWPLEYYRGLCDIILKNSSFKVAITGLESEKMRADYIKRGLGERVIDLTGKTNLRELALLAAEALVSVTNDSGPMHLLASSGSPAIVIFGPTNPDLIKPLSGNAIVMCDRIPCSPCYDGSVFPNRIGDCVDAVCMKNITPEKVFEKMCEIIKW